MYRFILSARCVSFLFLICFLIAGSGFESNGQSRQRKAFATFIDSFSINPDFQKERTVFPLEYRVWEPEMDGDAPAVTYMDSAMWSPLALMPREGEVKGPDGYGDYRLDFDVGRRKAVIRMRGVDNGIHTNFLFVKKKRTWYLYRIEDFST